MNAQQQAIALFLQLLAARPARRKELLKQQFSFIVVSHGEERIVAHGEFFAAGHPPLLGAVKTHAGLALQDVDGGAAFVPFFPSASFAPSAPVAPAAAPVAVPAAAPVAVPAPAPVVISTRSRRVHFGDLTEIRNASFQLVETFVTPSSGAVIEQLFDDGSMMVRFIGSIEKTWTI